MFDNIKTAIKEKSVKEILSKKCLDFISPISTTTGEINPYNPDRQKRGLPPKFVKRANLNGLTVKVTNDSYINLEGSLHKYFHGNNYCNFSRLEVLQAVNSIASTLNTNLSLMRLSKLEFGVNIELPFPVTTFLDSILCCKGQRPERSKYPGGGCQIKFSFNQYELKFYDKGKQYGLNKEILRVEVKVTTMQYLQAKGLDITTLNDLLNCEHDLKLKTLLINSIDSLIVNDHYPQKKQLTKPERSLLIQCNNPLYWFDLWNEKQTTYRKKKKKFRELNNKYGKLKLQSIVTNLVNDKWAELTKKTGTDINKIQTIQTTVQNDQILVTGTDITINLMGNISTTFLNPRFCKSCGREISHQKPGSLFCSEKLYGREGKKCRNRNSNPRNNFIKREQKEKQKGLLFDTVEYINVPEFKKLSVNYR